MQNIFKLFIIIASVLAIILLLNKEFPNALASDQNKISLLTTTVFLVLAISRISLNNLSFSTIANQIFAWIGIAIIALGIYSYKLEISKFSNRLIANLIPSYGQLNEDRTITYFAGENGHFNINATVNDIAKIEFMLDTGASVVTLTYQDAKRLGIDVENLVFNIPSSTANGLSWSASIRLESIRIGEIIIYDIAASVSKPNALSSSLLGMSFLKKLEKFSIEENKLILQK